jgi:hypothetical protein
MSQRVVSLSVFEMRHSGEKSHPYLKSGSPVVQVDLLGEEHNFENVGALIFEHYLSEKLGENLYDHMWRFEPYADDQYLYASEMDVEKPLLSKSMTASKQNLDSNEGDDDEEDDEYDEDEDNTYPLREGSEFIFFYDEGSPTRLIVTVDRILNSIPTDHRPEDYPVLRNTVNEEEQAAKRQRIATAPVLTIKMDQAYPYLSHRIFKDRGISFFLGRGCEPPIGSPEDKAFFVVYGGPPLSAYQRSVECYYPFTDLEEFFRCADRSIKKQISPGFPALIQEKTMHNTRTNEIYTTREIVGGSNPLKIVARLYPSYVSPSDYRHTMSRDFGFSTMRDAEERRTGIKCEESWSKWCFNFALSRDWRTIDPVNFSFVRQFPKCAKWLSHSSSIYYWMKMERGVLYAMKGRSQMKKQDNVVFQTMKHDNLHDMFVDMENRMVLPKSWKVKC